MLAAVPTHVGQAPQHAGAISIHRERNGTTRNSLNGSITSQGYAHRPSVSPEAAAADRKKRGESRTSVAALTLPDLTNNAGRRLSLGASKSLGRMSYERDPDRYERAAVRWLGRFALEARAVTIDALRAAADALDALPDRATEAMERLQALCSAHGVTESPSSSPAFARGGGASGRLSRTCPGSLTVKPLWSFGDGSLSNLTRRVATQRQR